jgi:hypothetical protein
MALTYTWEITGLKVKGEGSLTDVVQLVHWKKTGTDEDGNVGVFTSSNRLTENSADVNNFTPFEELTEEQILSWLEPIVGDVMYEEYINSQIQKQIDSDKNPVIDKVVPWSSSSPL